MQTFCKIIGPDTGNSTAFVHGSGLSHRTWDKIAAKFNDRKLILQDNFGHGRTVPWYQLGLNRAYTFYDDADLLSKNLANVSFPVDLVGYSAGGSICTAFSLRNPEKVRKLVLIEPILPKLLQDFDPIEWAEVSIAYRDAAARVFKGQLEGAAKLCFDYNLGQGYWDKCPETIKSKLIAMMENAIILQSSASLNFPESDKVSNMKVPLLIIYGNATRRGICQMSHALKAITPHAKMVEIHGATHSLIQSHHKQIAQHIFDFLGKITI